MIRIGVDAGGTLIKIACLKNGSIQYMKFHASQMQSAAEWMNEFERPEVCITGGRAAMLQSYLNRPAVNMVEFDATCDGVRYLLQTQGAADEAHILTNVGTGTSIHHLHPHSHRRLGGTGVGGGTLMGLSQLLTGISDYEELVQSAAKGSRDQIDLKVRHIYKGTEPPIPGDLTASNFGNVDSGASPDQLPKSDLLASVFGLVGETVATASVLAATQCGVSSILYIGSSFDRNELLKEVVEGYTKLRGATPMFFDNGEYCGAIGALLKLG